MSDLLTQTPKLGVRPLMRRRQPSSLTGMHTQFSGNLGAKPLNNPDDRSKQLGNMYDRLLADDNPAADQAERTTLGELGTQRAEREASFGQEAAQMGLKPGDVGYEQARTRAMSPLASQGSSIMAGLAQRRMTDQRQNLNDAASFNLGQQNFNAGREDQKTRNMFDLLGMSDLLSEGQASAVKSGLGSSLGLGGGTWNDKDADPFTQAVQSQVQFYKATRPGISDAEALAMAQKDIGTMNPATYLNAASGSQYTGIPGSGAPAAGAAGGSPQNAVQEGLDMMGNFMPTRRAEVHALGEMGRGVRDMMRGDLGGGATRASLAPTRAAVHGVAQAGRNAKKAWDYLF